MHISDGKQNNQGKDHAPRHAFMGGAKHQPKHMCDIPRGNKGIAVFVVALVFLVALIALRYYSLLLVPFAVALHVVSICSVAKRATFFSVTAVVVSSLAFVLTALQIVFAITEFFTGTVMASFTVFS